MRPSQSAPVQMQRGQSQVLTWLTNTMRSENTDLSKIRVEARPGDWFLDALSCMYLVMKT